MEQLGDAHWSVPIKVVLPDRRQTHPTISAWTTPFAQIGPHRAHQVCAPFGIGTGVLFVRGICGRYGPLFGCLESDAVFAALDA